MMPKISLALISLSLRPLPTPFFNLNFIKYQNNGRSLVKDFIKYLLNEGI